MAGHRWAGRLLSGLVGALLLLTLVTPYWLGAAGAYLQIFCTLLCLLALLVQRARFALKGDPGFKLLLLAFVILLVSFALTAKSPHDAVYGLNFAMLAMFGPLSAFFARFAAPGNVRIVASLALAGSLIAFAVAAVQAAVFGFVRATGWETDPIWSAQAAVLLAFVASLGVGLGGRWRAIYVAGPVLGFGTCLLSGSRGPMLAIPVLALIVIFGLSSRRLLVLAAVCVGGAAMLTASYFLLPASFARFASLLTVGDQLATSGNVVEISTGTRLAFYRAGIEAFMHAPLLGYGWDGKMQAIVPYLPGDGAAMVAPHHHLHSDLLDFGVSGGIAGLIAYALILLAPIVAVFRSPRDRHYRLRTTGMLVVAAGYFTCGLTYLMFGFEFHTTLYVVLTALLLGYCRDPVEDTDATRA